MESDTHSRFERLAERTAGGMKIASRRDVNPRLTHAETVDCARFLASLSARFGPPDQYSDAEFSYCIRDRSFGIDFMAYAAQSGPAYGGNGPDHCVDFDHHDYRIKSEVMQCLIDFETWL